jgi:hypothetical protein
MSIHTKGNSQIQDGVLSVDQISPNSDTNSTVGVVAFNEMTTAELSTYNDPESTIVKNTDTGEWIACKGLVRSQLSNQITGAIPPITVIGRGSGFGTGSPQTLALTNQFAFTGGGLTLGLVQDLNRFNQTPAVLDYQIANDPASVSISSLTEAQLKSFTVSFNTMLANGDNIWGRFAGTFSTSSTPTGNIRLYVNNVQVMDSQASLSPSGSWYMDFQIMRSSPTNLRASGKILWSSSGGQVSFTNFANVVFNPSTAFTIQARALVGNTGNNINCQIASASAAKNI